MKKYQVLLSFFWVVLGLFASIYSYRLGLGSIRTPGPGLFPFCLGTLFFCLALAVAVTAVRAPGEEGAEEKERPAGLRKLGLVAAALFAYALLVDWLGYLVTTFLTVALLFASAGYRRLVQILGYSFAVVVISYFLFTYLGVRFPAGIFRPLGLD